MDFKAPSHTAGDVILHTLPNGLRVAQQLSAGNVAYIGVLVNAGSRDDATGRDGLAHFVEHTIFKGTPTKKSWQVSNRMELIGGELNAYTTKEEIMLYTNAPAGYEERAIELLYDLTARAAFPAQELDMERNVIIEEIHSYDDNPSYAVYDEFDELFFKDSRLAHNILGYKESVEKIKSEDCREFIRNFFVPEEMVVYCVTPTAPEKCLRLIEKYFGGVPSRPTALDRRYPEPVHVFDETRRRDNSQANVVTGLRIFNSSDPRRYALYLYSSILGGSSMNSRLNRELRERRGLVYTVESSISLYSDTGLFQVYYATDPGNVRRCQDTVRREIERLASTPLSDRAFRQARRQLCGQLIVGAENRENAAMNLAKSLLRHDEVHDSAYTASKIMDTSPSDLLEIARLVAEAPASRLILA